MSEENEDESLDLFSGDEEAKGGISFNIAATPVDRPRGILSPTDRDYLCGLKDYSHSQTELNRQQSIRERTVEGIRDFDLLWLLLDESEWEKIMDAFETEEVNAAFSSMVAFMYIGLNQDTDRIEGILEQGIYEAVNHDLSGRWPGGANDVSVDINIDRHPDVDELYERFKKGESDQLTPAEIGTLVQAGKLDSGDLQELESTNQGFPSVYASGALEQTNNKR
jgi:hypothetical protein